jgi:hypothetical protein
MSKPVTHAMAATGGPGTPNEDGMNIAKIVVVGAVSLIIFAISAVIAGLIVSGDAKRGKGEVGTATIPEDIARKEEIGIIDYVPFDADTRLDRWKAERHHELTTYGWADRSKGLIRMPIERAMKEVIEKAAGGPNK